VESQRRPADRIWIGGSPCSGKSTVAGGLASTRGWSLYTCDDHWDEHVRREPSARLSVLGRLASLPIDLRLRQPLDIQVADVIEAYREEFPLIRADLAGTVSSTIVEGAALMPELLATIQIPTDRALWLVPTEKFQRAHYARRTWARELLDGISDADDLFEMWMRRDAAFARQITMQAEDFGYHVITVDADTSAESVLAEVSAWLPESL
jgi:hypothetical protein